MTDVNHSRTDAQEKHAVLLILSVEFGDYHVHRRLACGVQRLGRELVLVHEVHISKTGGDGYDFLGLAFQDKRDEQVDEVDVGNDVDFEQLIQVLLKLLRPVAPFGFVMSVSIPNVMSEMRRHGLTEFQWDHRHQIPTRNLRWR